MIHLRPLSRTMALRLTILIDSYSVLLWCCVVTCALPVGWATILGVHDVCGGGDVHAAVAERREMHMYLPRQQQTVELYSLVRGVGFCSEHYTLEPLQVAAIPEGSELVACDVVPASRGMARRDNASSSSLSSSSGRRINSMLCLAMRPPQNGGCNSSASGQRGDEGQGDAAAGPQPPSGKIPNSTATAPPSGATAAAHPCPTLGLLNVYELQSNRGFDVADGVLQREPQQIALQYDPEGVAHVTVWRTYARKDRCPAAGNFRPTTAIPSTSNGDHFAEERGDAVLVWGRDGVLHGYVRWESEIMARGGGWWREGTSQYRKSSNGNASSNNGGSVAAGGLLVREEAAASLEALLPELKTVGAAPIFNVSADTLEDDSGSGPPRRVRKLIIGCRDGTYLFSTCLEVGSDGRNGTVACSYLIRDAAATALNIWCFTSNSTPEKSTNNTYDSSTSGERKVIGFACGRLGMVICFTREGGGSRGEGNIKEPIAVASTRGAAQMLDADSVLCTACGDFCRDGSTTVAIGTKSGTVTVYDVLQECGGNDCERLHMELEEKAGRGGETFEVAWADEDEQDIASSQAPRRGESNSPRGSGADWRFTGGGRQSVSNNTKLRHMAFKWQKHLPYPVFGITVGDFNDDGIGEMVVVTKHGVHVLRPDYGVEAARLGKVLDALKVLEPREENEGEDDCGS